MRISYLTVGHVGVGEFIYRLVLVDFMSAVFEDLSARLWLEILKHLKHVYLVVVHVDV